MKASNLVIGKHYNQKEFPDTAIEYKGTIPSGYGEGKHLFRPSTPGAIGCICTDNEVEEHIKELKMKVSNLVIGKYYALSVFPSEKLEYRGLMTKADDYFEDHIFINDVPEGHGRIPGCICSDAQVEQSISEFKEQVEQSTSEKKSIFKELH